MPESAYTSVDLEPPPENADSRRKPRNRLSRHSSGAKDVMLKAD
jgi:hypothetical protein